jgi:hypothetical protein
MNKILLLVLFLNFLNVFSYAQNVKVDSLLGKWKEFFNKRDHEKSYGMYANFYKEKVDLEKFTKSLTTIFHLMGPIKSFKYVSFNGQYYKYLFFGQNDVEADVIVVVDVDSKFRYLNFETIGGKDDAPPVGKMN